MARGTITTVIITFFGTFILNYLVGLIFRPDGYVILGPPIQIDAKYFQTADIVNYSKTPIDHLRIYVPKDINESDILFTTPISIKTLVTNTKSTQSKLIEISEIKENSLIRLFFPLKDIKDYDGIKFINTNEKNLFIYKNENIEHPNIIIFKNALTNSLLYALFFGSFFYFVKRIWDKLENRLHRVEERYKEVETEAKNVLENSKLIVKEKDEETKKIYVRAMKVKTLLLVRISDYSKELNFWRDTIRKILYSQKNDPGIADEIFKQVTSTLTTYSVLQKSDELSGDIINYLTDQLK